MVLNLLIKWTYYILNINILTVTFFLDFFKKDLKGLLLYFTLILLHVIETII